MKWFKHDTDAHTSLKLQAVIEKFGLEAYGYYWVCDELVGKEGENFKLKPEKNWKIYMRKFVGIEIEKQEIFLEFFAEINLIDKKALKLGSLFIPKLGERADEYTKRVRRVSEQDTDNVPLEEKRIDKKRKEETALPDWLDKKVWNEWVEYRKEKKKSLTQRSIDLQLKELAQNIPTHKAIIEQSIRNGWVGLFALKEEAKKYNGPPERKYKVEPPKEILTPEQEKEKLAGLAKIRASMAIK